MDKTPVMINGLPGSMAMEVARQVIKSEDFKLHPVALASNRLKNTVIGLGEEEIQLFSPIERKKIVFDSKFREEGLVVDFTTPDALNPNGEFYCENGLDFVMGTTGGNRSALEERVKSSQVSAVISPNMGKQIVALQNILENLARELPDSLTGYSLSVQESHQLGKKDTSGTAKAIVGYFNRLGIPFDVSQVKMIRDPEQQERILGVPKMHLSGHGWHTYVLEGHKIRKPATLELYDRLINFLMFSPVFKDYKITGKESTENRLENAKVSQDGNVLFRIVYDIEQDKISLTHNVNGRSIYAEGTLDALRFLREKRAEKGRVYSMKDVLLAHN